MKAIDFLLPLSETLPKASRSKSDCHHRRRYLSSFSSSTKELLPHLRSLPVHRTPEFANIVRIAREFPLISLSVSREKNLRSRSIQSWTLLQKAAVLLPRCISLSIYTYVYTYVHIFERITLRGYLRMGAYTKADLVLASSLTRSPFLSVKCLVHRQTDTERGRGRKTYTYTCRSACI